MLGLVQLLWALCLVSTVHDKAYRWYQGDKRSIYHCMRQR